MWAKIKAFFSAAIRRFRRILRTVIKGAMEAALAEIQELAIMIVADLNRTDLSNPEKHAEAFRRIRKIATDKGVEVKDNWINFAIPIAVEAIKKEF